MNNEKYINWKSDIFQMKKDIEAEIVNTMKDNGFNSFVRLVNTVPVSLRNGLFIRINMLENKNDAIIYYAGPMPYLLDEMSLEGINDVYFALIQSINNPRVEEREIF